MRHEPRDPSPPFEKVRVAISSCLLGENVRFDGGHKRDPYLVGTLGRFFDWVPVCPEFEIGLGAPRESLRLVASGEGARLVAPKSGNDLSERMRAFAAERLRALRDAGIHGYVLKKDSPTCGLFRVRVYPSERAKGDTPRRDGVGLFAREIGDAIPGLPVEEEGRLQDMPLRENFVERVFAHHRFARFLAGRPRAKDLVAFHAASKYTLLAHAPELYRSLGRLVAGAGASDLGETLATYRAGYFEALRHRATPAKQANVLAHLLGFLKRDLDSESRAELVATIEEYRKGLVPLVVPLTLLRHHFRRHPNPWVSSQTWLHPYPAELMLRNHV